MQKGFVMLHKKLKYFWFLGNIQAIFPVFYDNMQKKTAFWQSLF